MLVHKMSVLLRFLYTFQFFQELYFIISIYNNDIFQNEDLKRPPIYVQMS